MLYIFAVSRNPARQHGLSFSLSLEGEGDTMGVAIATPAVNAELAKP